MAAQKERETADRVTADGVRRDAEFARLTSENDSLRAELTKVKGRYKTMRGLLEEAEVKSKVGFLLHMTMEMSVGSMKSDWKLGIMAGKSHMGTIRKTTLEQISAQFYFYTMKVALFHPFC